MFRLISRCLVPTIATACACACACAGAGAAFAGTWVVPVADGTIALPFAARYDAATHRGADISAAAGDPVVSPAAGTVLFVGRIPADGGGTCLAVTIDAGEGMKVSMLPLSGASVSKGQSVSPGDAIGTVAETGDSSTASPHLHLGLRSNGIYVDPTPMLAPVVSPVPEASGPADTPATGSQTPVSLAPAAGVPAAAPGVPGTPIACEPADPGCVQVPPIASAAIAEPTPESYAAGQPAAPAPQPVVRNSESAAIGGRAAVASQSGSYLRPNPEQDISLRRDAGQGSAASGAAPDSQAQASMQSASGSPEKAPSSPSASERAHEGTMDSPGRSIRQPWWSRLVLPRVTSGITLSGALCALVVAAACALDGLAPVGNR